MTFIEMHKARTIICKIARREKKSPKQIHCAMQEALDAAWTAAWQPGNIHAQVTWQRLFPGGRKPAVEEFIARCSMIISPKIE